jgi:hypothetical protein
MRLSTSKDSNIRKRSSGMSKGTMGMSKGSMGLNHRKSMDTTALNLKDMQSGHMDAKA